MESVRRNSHNWSRTLEDKVRALLEDFSKGLCSMIGQSPELEAKLAKLHAVGYSLNLLLDCRKHVESEEVQKPKRTLLPQSAVSSGSAIAEGTTSEPPAIRFKINSEDLAFLRSVGIDPTRPARTRRTSP